MEENLSPLVCSNAINNHGAIGICRLPNEDVCHVFVSNKTPELRRLDEKNIKPQTFVFAPYSSANLAYVIIPEKYTTCKQQQLLELSHKQIPFFLGSPNISLTQAEFEEYVGDAIGAITDGATDKVVAARCVAAPKPAHFDSIEFFIKLCNTYVGAYVYLFSSPDSGTWIGASPELLISKTDRHISSVALAGTKPINDDSPWLNKEKSEQKYVEQFLSDAFAKQSKQKVSITPVQEIEAGNIKHLCSNIQINTDAQTADKQLQKILAIINPTPAVCGTPQLEASLFISENEGMERRFYSGFSGLIDHKKQVKLYVTLRCMELLHTEVLIYAGAGITRQSNASAEWIETTRKIETLLGLL
jgi:isochorismate synthase